MKMNRTRNQHVQLGPVDWEIVVVSLEKQSRYYSRAARNTGLAWARARFEVLSDETRRLATDIASQL